MAVATREIVAAGRARAAIQEDIRKKEAARKALSKKYASRKASPDDILNAIYSFSDNNTYLRFNRDPVDRMLAYLRDHFDPRDPAKGSLAISSGAQRVPALAQGTSVLGRVSRRAMWTVCGPPAPQLQFVTI